MLKSTFLIACCLVASAAFAVPARSAGPKSDPITGRWTGALTPGGAPSPTPVTLQLTIDGRSAVSGTFSGLPNPGDVKKGSGVTDVV